MSIKPFTILFLSLLNLNVAKAQYFDQGVLHVLEDANDNKIINNDFSGDLCGKLSESDIVLNSFNLKRDMQECALSLCGPPSDNKSAYITNKSFLNLVPKDLLNNINKLEPKMKKVLDESSKKVLRNMTEAQKNIRKDISDLRPNEWSSKFKVKLSKDIFGPYIDVVINLNKTIDERLKVKVNIPQDASDDFKNELILYAKKIEANSKYNLSEASDLGLYTDIEQKGLIKEKLDKMKTAFNIDKGVLSDFSKNHLDVNLKFLEEKLKDESNSKLDLLSRVMTQVEDHAEKMPSYKKQFELAICSDEHKCESLFKEYIQKQKLDEKLSLLESKTKDPTLLRESLISCKAQILADAISHGDEKKAKEIFKKAREKIELNVLSKFSAHSRKILQKELDQILVKSSAEAAADFDPVQNFNEKLDSLNIENSDSPLNFSQEASLAFALDNSEDLENFNPYLTFTPCSEKKSNASDSFVRGDVDVPFFKKMLSQYNRSEINISAFSCSHEKTGESVVAHELGHAISHIFKNMKLSEESAAVYESLGNCVKGNYKIPLSSDLTLEHRMEEDFADTISAMAYPDNSVMKNCSQLEPSANETNYLNLDFIGFTDEVHSSALFRILIEATNKNVELPISCQKAFQPMKNKLRLNKCAI